MVVINCANTRESQLSADYGQTEIPYIVNTVVLYTSNENLQVTKILKRGTILTWYRNPQEWDNTWYRNPQEWDYTWYRNPQEWDYTWYRNP